MAETSAGKISLDLVIKDNLTEQLDKIKAKVNAPAESTGEAISDAVSKAVEKASGAITSSIENAVNASQGSIEKLSGTVSDMVAKIKETLENAAPSSGLEQKFSAVLDNVIEKLDLLQKKWEELSAGDPFSSSAERLNRAAQSLSETADVLGSVRPQDPIVPDEPVPERYSVRWRDAFSRIKSAGGKAFSYLKNAGCKAVSAISKALKGILLAASIYAAFQAVKDGIFDVIKADEQFSKSLAEVKQNLSVAFAPIVQAVMPALNTLMSGLAAVTRQIAAFIAGVFGKTYKEASAAAQKLKDVTAAAKKAKLATAGIDEMNILSSGSDDEKSSGSTFTDIPEPELPDWAEKLKDALRSGDWYSVGAALANGINKALGSINWDKISKKVSAGAEKIAEGINGFLDNIDWDTLGETLAGGLNTLSNALNTFTSRVKWDKLGSGIAAGLNRAIKKTNWKMLGSSLGRAVQGIISAAYSFAVNFDWSGFGNAIGDTVNGWFEAVDFGKAAQTLSLGIEGVLRTASSALDRTDFHGIGKKLSDALNNIDIPGIAGEFAKTLSSIITGALDLAIGLVENTKWSKLPGRLFDSLAAMLKNIDWGKLVARAYRLAGAAVAAQLSLAVGLVRKVGDVLSKAYSSVKSYFSGKIEDCGGNIVKGLFTGITDALKNVAVWIKDHIFKPFIDGFKSAFGIASPSKVMAEMGCYIIDGLCKGVSDGIGRVKEIFSNILGTIKGVFTGIGDWFSSTFSNAWSSAKSAFSAGSAGTHFKNVVASIKNAFIGFSSFFHDKFSTAWNRITGVFNSTGKYFSGVYNSIINAFKNIPDKIGGYFSSAFDKIRSSLSELTEWVDKKLSNVPFVGEVYSGAKSLIKKAVSKISLPHLASGGIATAPTLAMVGDNSNARVDPEVISPLSKLRDMTGADPEIVELLRVIVELLRSGMNIEIINYMFRNSREFSREVIKAVAEDKERRGG